MMRAGMIRERWVDKWMRRWVETRMVRRTEWIWKLIPKTSVQLWNINSLTFPDNSGIRYHHLPGKHSQQQRLRLLLFLCQLRGSLIDEWLERVCILLHDRQHVVEDVRTSAISNECRIFSLDISPRTYSSGRFPHPDNFLPDLRHFPTWGISLPGAFLRLLKWKFEAGNFFEDPH